MSNNKENIILGEEPEEEDDLSSSEEVEEHQSTVVSEAKSTTESTTNMNNNNNNPPQTNTNISQSETPTTARTDPKGERPAEIKPFNIADYTTGWLNFNPPQEKKVVERNENIRRLMANKLVQFYSNINQQLYKASTENSTVHTTHDASNHIGELNDNISQISKKLTDTLQFQLLK